MPTHIKTIDGKSHFVKESFEEVQNKFIITRDEYLTLNLHCSISSCDRDAPDRIEIQPAAFMKNNIVMFF